MTATYNVSGFPAAAVGNAIPDLFARLVAGMLTTLTCCASATNPSTSAPVAWGAADVGRYWLDTGVDGTAANPVLKQWCQVTAGPTYDFRRLRWKKTKWLATPVAIAAINALSPASADAAFAAFSLATTLDTAGVQDTGDVARKVSAVWLRVKFRGGAAETLGTGATETPYVAFRATGATDEQRLGAVADGGGFSARGVERTFHVTLDGSEQLDFAYLGGGGTKAGVFEVYLLGFEEES